jgi:peptide/nickel transport system permease protein
LKKIFNIRHLLLLLLLIIFIFRFSIVVNSLLLLFFFIKLLFTDPSVAAARFDFSLFDCFVSTLLTLLGVAGLIILEIAAYGHRLNNVRFISVMKKRLSFLNNKISFTSFAVIILLFCYIFAPLITSSNPDFQKDINVTRLLSPFSSVAEIISTGNTEQQNPDSWYILKDKVIKNSFDDHIIFADSIKINNSQVTLFQNGLVHILLFKGKISNQYQITSRLFLLGTDEFGRDIFSRLIYGARVSITVGLLSVFITFILGSLLGFFAGYTGGFVDSFLNRLSDMFLSFPVIFLIILILALFGNSVVSVIVVLGFSGWMSLFKIVRSEIISLKKRDYFLTAKLMGTGSINLIFLEMLPVIAAPVIVNLVFQFGNVILAESALSYIGLGTGGSIPSWGSMIEAGQGYIYRAWWMILFPGLALFFSLFITNNLGNRIKVILNPRLRT